MHRSNGSVRINGKTVLKAAEHTICSDACAQVLYFCAIYGFPVNDYLWLL